MAVFLVWMLCYQVEVSVTDRCLVQRSPNKCVCVCHRLWSGVIIALYPYNELMKEVRLKKKDRRKNGWAQSIDGKLKTKGTEILAKGICLSTTLFARRTSLGSIAELSGDRTTSSCNSHAMDCHKFSGIFMKNCSVIKMPQYCFINGDRCGTVVKVLCYKSEGRWFESRWGHCNFHWYNPTHRTMVLWLTQTLTEMSTRSISWG